MDASQAARALNCPEPEIEAVEDTNDGRVVAFTTDGQAYLLDGGGVSFLTAPSASYGGAFPVAYPLHGADENALAAHGSETLASLGVEAPAPEPERSVEPVAEDGPERVTEQDPKAKPEHKGHRAK